MDKKNDTLVEKLTIIGIGSSAGGLEAIRELVSTLPRNAQVSYVVVQHMSPHHKSLMTELVARQTKLTVRDVEDGLEPQPNVIYITPPKTDVILQDGCLRLVDPSPEPASPKPSVDRFLTSLADAHGEHTAAIILSGTGSDGSHGVQAIREAGGITIAQDTESAKYDGMPHNAVQTGCIDLILRPEEIGTHLEKILSSARDFESFRKGDRADTPLADLLQILLARTRVDFRDYKQTTINRRIERRMVALGIDTQEEYTQFCRNNPQALDALFKDLLISVTRFFRDKDEFKHLQTQLNALLETDRNGPFRIWIAGCATGEEAYSIAMLVCEALGGPETQLKKHAQIFATDIDKDALKVARRGVYGVSALNEIPSDLADKYLIRQADGVRMIDNLRGAILFSDHNVCQDPPFQKIDLLCCRNLLIYFGPQLQQKVMQRFHYAMAPDGLMFLGTAESVAGSDELFIQENHNVHIYRRRVLRDGMARSSYSEPRKDRIRSTPPPSKTPVAPSTESHLLEGLIKTLGKNSILVTDDYSIARVYGDVSPFIEMKAGSSLRMHLDLLRSPLREEARSLVTIALRNESHRSGVRHLLATDNDRNVRLDVYPIIADQISERAALVVFTDEVVKEVGTVQIEPSASTDIAVAEQIRALQTEVESTREALQQTIEELETSNEELQSLNEELQSTNEELQATNEELETSNEELQSTNEELITVNEELQVTASELSGRTGELTSVIESTPLAIIVMDTALQISQATAQAAKLFGLQFPLAHPHISQCALPEGYPSLAPLCSEALRMGTSVEREFNANDSRVDLSCSPYFNVHGQILGVTMVVTEFPGLAREMELILSNSKFHVLHRKTNGTILRLSDAAAKMLGHSREEALGMNYYDLIDDRSAKEARETDKEMIELQQPVRRQQITVTPKGESIGRILQLEQFPYIDQGDEAPTVYTIGNDITDQVIAKQAAEHLSSQALLLQDMAGVGYWTLTLATEEVYWSRQVYKLHGVDPDEETPPLQDAIKFYHPDDAKAVQEHVSAAIENKGSFHFVKRLVQRGGKVIKVESHGLAVTDHLGDVTHLLGVFREA